MIQEFFIALGIISQPSVLVLVLVGVLIGIILGAIPGLGGVVTLALLLPVSLLFDPTPALVFLMASLAGLNFGGSIPAILLNIPGTAPSVMTTIDGFPMAKNNRAAEAIGASAGASALGAVIGFVFLMLTLPIVRRLLMFFGPPEFMLVAVIGGLSIAYVLKGSFLSGLIATLVGVSLGFHGFNQVTGALRFDFGILYLYDGIPLIGVVIGLFAIGEMINLGLNRETVSTNPEALHGSPLRGLKAVISNKITVLRGAVIGIGIGLIPAVGATVSTLISYASESKNDPAAFGDGNVRGVIAPEASNDAKDASSLVPTLAFGIPGSPSHAVLLGGLLLHGITPGPGVFDDALVTILAMIFALLIGNILTSAIGIVSAKQLVRITMVPLGIVIPVVVVFSLFGAYAYRANPYDVLILIPIGLFGYLAVKHELSRVALLFGLILGPIIESTFHQTLQIARGDYLSILLRPAFLAISVSFLLIVVAVALYSSRR